MTTLTPEMLRAATSGTWIARMPEITLPADRPADLPLPPLHSPITGVSTDTRTIRPGNLFIALRGETHNGHEYLIDAVKAGAEALIVDDTTSIPSDGFKALTQGKGVGVLKVADTGKALLSIAAAYRKSFTRTKVIAVCGSNGKTTTTRMIHAVLAAGGLKGSHSPKSFNNSVGVPLTILSAKPTDQYLICEVGTNAPGEIAELGTVVQPDIAVIVSLGREHLEGLGDLTGVAKEEAAILATIRAKGTAIVNRDAPELMAQVKTNATYAVVTFGKSAEANLRATNIRTVRADASTATPFSVQFGVNGRGDYRLPMLGEHNALNALAAIAVARRLNIDEPKVVQGLASVPLPELRMEQRLYSLAPIAPSATVIADCYNANPDSMIAAIDTISRIAASPLGTAGDAPRTASPRRIAVLGDMLELGTQSEEMHRQVLNRLNVLETEAVAVDSGSGTPSNPLPGAGKFDLVVLVGERMRKAATTLTAAGWPHARVITVADVGDPSLADAVASLIQPGDLVLLKGSRRTGLERVLPAIARRAANAGASPLSSGGGGTNSGMNSGTAPMGECKSPQQFMQPAGISA